MAPKFYVRIAEGLDDSGFLYPKDDFEKSLQEGFASENDQYSSVYLYNEDHYKQFQTTKSVRGIKNVVTDRIIFDFDSDNDPELARKDTLELVNRLKAKSIDPDNIDLYWSGKKGFTVNVKLDRTITPEVHEKVALDVFGKGLQTLDRGVYNASRILRVPNTKHPKSHLYKVKLTYSQLQTLDVDKIKKLAAKPTDKIKLSNPIKLQDDVFQLPAPVKKEKTKLSSTNTVNTLAPRHWKDYKWAILNAEGLKAGERHYAMMVIAATCRGLGYNQELTESFLRTFDTKYSEVTKQGENEEEISLTLSSVFSENWNGGQYSIENNAWLRSYCERMGFNSKPDKLYIGIDDLHTSFSDFALNFEKNLVKTGIEELDKHTTFMTSTHNGLLGKPGSGKCLGKDTPVIMFDGTIKKVQDIKVGELLMGDDSTPRRVLSTCTGREMLYKIKQSNGDDYIVNESHILSLKGSSSSSKYTYGKIFDIPLKDYIKQSPTFKKRVRGYKVAVEFEKKSLKIDPYVLGIWLGDGTTTKPEFTINNNDTEIVDYLTEWATKNNMTANLKHYKNNRGCNTISITGDQLFRNFLTHNKLTMGKYIPEDYLYSSREDRLKLLAGILDTDGYYEKDKNTYELTNSNEKLSKDITYLIRSLGFKVTVNKKNSHYKSLTKGKLYEGYSETNRFYITGNNLSEIPVRVPRRKAVDGTKKTHQDLCSIQVEKLEVGDYYGFEIDGNHRFLLGDFTVTHNTSLMLQWLAHANKNDISSICYSLDMSRQTIYGKMLQNVSGCSFTEGVKKFKEDSKWLDDQRNKIKNKWGNVDFNFKSGVTVDMIKDDIKRQEDMTGKKVKLLMVDYLECLQSKFSDPTVGSGMISNELKDLANEMELCSILLLQTQKHSTSDISDPLLSMSKIKGSSLIEQSMSSILTLWREGYNPNTVQDDRFISFAVVKNRFGGLWTDDFSWNGKIGEIASITDEGREHIKELRAYKKALKSEEASENGWN